MCFLRVPASSRLGRSGWISLIGLVLVACDPAPSTFDAGPPAPPGAARLRWKDGFPALISTSSAPTVYSGARRRWRTATVAFSLGDLETSATAFLDLAEQLRRSELSHPEHQGAFRAARCMAYENVGAIYRGLDDADRGAALLRKARVEDPACAHTITRTLSRFRARGSRRAPPRDAR